MDLGREITLEALFDEEDIIVDKSVFKEEALRRLQSSGQNFEVEETKTGFIAKVIDPFRSQGYNTFKSDEEYRSWLKASLHEPTQDDIEEAMNGARA